MRSAAAGWVPMPAPPPCAYGEDNNHPLFSLSWTIARQQVAGSSKKRQAASSIKIDPNVRCLRIYPVEDNRNSTKTIADLKTVGIKLSRNQAIHLARVL